MCFNCDETYHLGHKSKRLFLIWVEDEEEGLEEPLRLQELEDNQKEPQVSLNAVAGCTHSDTIKLLGRAANKNIIILLDSGSTHSFLDPNVAKMLGCMIEVTKPWVVTVADGNRVECNSKCPCFEWEIWGFKFTTPVRLLKLGGCDMVIGVDLLGQFGQVTLDFKNHIVGFNMKGREVRLQGIQAKPRIDMVTAEQLDRVVRKEKGAVCSLPVCYF